MLSLTQLPPSADSMLRAELGADERLLWTGQPNAARAALKGIPIMLFGLPFTGFSVFWVVNAFQMQQRSGGMMPIFFPLFGLIFVFVGLGLLSSPLWIFRQSRGTVYAVTDKRAVIMTPNGLGAVTVRAIDPADTSPRTRTQNRDGSGSLLFNNVTVTRRRAGPDGGNYQTPIGFENIPQVREVEDLIDRTFR